MIKETLRKIFISFSISALAGLMVNLIIDLAVTSATGSEDFCSISPDFRALFPTSTLAAYVNVLIYGLIGATFAGMTFIYDFPKISFAVQSIIYFLTTGTVCLLITMLLWQLQRYPQAFISTLSCYAMTHVLMFFIEYRRLKKDIKDINDICG